MTRPAPDWRNRARSLTPEARTCKAVEAGLWANACPTRRKDVVLKLKGVNNAMTIAREEILDPVPRVIRVDGLDNAMAVSNHSPYGLAAGLWSGNVTTPLRRVKLSGGGRDKSLHAFDNVTNRKSVWLDLTPAPGAIP